MGFTAFVLRPPITPQLSAIPPQPGSVSVVLARQRTGFLLDADDIRKAAILHGRAADGF